MKPWYFGLACSAADAAFYPAQPEGPVQVYHMTRWAARLVHTIANTNSQKRLSATQRENFSNRKTGVGQAAELYGRIRTMTMFNTIDASSTVPSIIGSVHPLPIG